MTNHQDGSLRRTSTTPTKHHRFFCKGMCKRELNGYYMGDCPFCSGIVEAQVWEGERQV